MTQPKLKPCPNPWCVTENRRNLRTHSTTGQFCITCECGLHSPYADSHELAVAAWNTRVIDPKEAAAPDMYEALEVLVEATGPAHIELSSVKAVRQMGKLLEAQKKAEAALTKAGRA